MNYRLNKPLIIALAAFILFAIFLFSAVMKSSSPQEAPEPDQTQQELADTTAPDTTRIITAKHDFEDGMHVLVGEIEMPTACERLEATPFFVDGNNANVEVQFTTINETPGECEPAITPARFKVEFEGPEDAAISATLDGESIVLNLVRVPEGEDIDTFSEFIKG